MATPRRPRARKALGQHWLTDSRYLARIAAAVDPAPEETVIEVGPGTGLLTQRLAERASHLIALEIDTRLVDSLKGRFADRAVVRVIEGDVLALDAAAILDRGEGGLPYVLAGNLPYYIGTAVVRHFLRDRVPPRRIIVMLQAEVAANMAAQPGGMGYLSVETQVFAEVKVLFRIPPRAFRPAPKVDSALVRLDVRESPEVEVDDIDRFLALARAGFAAPRKRLRNSLAIGLRAESTVADRILERAGVDGGRRPAELSLDEWRAAYFAARAEEAAP